MNAALDAAAQREAQLQLKADLLQVRRARAAPSSCHWQAACVATSDTQLQAQLTDASLKAMSSNGSTDHVDILEENLKRQIQDTETLRRDVLVQKLEFEKQTAALNALIARIHTAQLQAPSSDRLSDDSTGALSPIKRVPSDGDAPTSPLNSLDVDTSDSAAEQDDGGSSSDDCSDDGEVGRHRQRLLSIVAEVDGEDESLSEHKVVQLDWS
jgi:hypothetical protein